MRSHKPEDDAAGCAVTPHRPGPFLSPGAAVAPTELAPEASAPPHLGTRPREAPRSRCFWRKALCRRGGRMTERAHNPYHGFPGGRPAWPTATWQQRAGTEANKPNAALTRRRG